MNDQIISGGIVGSTGQRQLQKRALNVRVAKPTNVQVAIWGGILLLLVGVSLSNYQSYQLGTHFDDSRYVVLARSLISSPTYGMVNVPGAPDRAKYPFGYPLILTPFLLLFPNNLDVLKVPSLIATVLIAVILFWGWQWFYPKKSYWWGLAVTGMYALNPLTIDHSRRVMSEPVFTFFSLAAILLAEQYARGKRAWWWGLVMSAALIFTMFTRSIGIVLVGMVFIYLLVRVGRAFWKEIPKLAVQIAFLLGLMVILTPVQIQDLLPVEYLKDENARFIVALFNGGQRSIQEPLVTSPADNPQPDVSPSPSVDTRPSSSLQTLFFFGIKQHLGSDLRIVAFPIGGGAKEQELARQIGFPLLPAISGYIVSALVIFGFFSLLRQNLRSLFLLFAAVYFTAIFFWTWNDPRLLYPIVAQIAFALMASLEAIILGVTRIIHRKSALNNSPNYVLGALMILLFAGSIYKSTLIDDSRLHAGDVRARSVWLAAHSNPADILMTEAPETDYLYSGLKTVVFPPLTSADNFLDRLHEQNVRYILVAPDIEWQQQYSPRYGPDLQQFFPVLDELNLRNQIRLVYSSVPDGIKVYQVQR